MTAKRTKILTVVGARPQFIKAAAVSRVIAASTDFDEVLVHTGQHFDDMMSDVFFRELDIPVPAERLAIGGMGHGAMTGRMLEAVEATILAHKPDWVMVYGDTNSTLAGALAAAKLHVPIVHVEAGLRSYNRAMPEEINRVLTDHMSTLLLSPTRTGVTNLEKEGITRGVHHVGDVMFDALKFAMTRARSHGKVVAALDIDGRDICLATLHRAENTDHPERLKAIVRAMRDEAASRDIILPLHPRTRNAVARHGIDLSGIRVIDPVGYIDMACLLDRASLVITDSGGLQKEAYFAGRRCITLRDETEWPETITHGWNRLWTTKAWVEPQRPIEDFGDGNASGAVLDAIRRAPR